MSNDLYGHEAGTKGSQPVGFTEWYQEYMTTDGNKLYKDSDIIKAVNSDELDADFIEERIRESTPKDPVVKGFCSKCQNLFDNWPTLGGSSTREHNSKPDPNGGGWEHAVTRLCSTFEIEGSARSGCRFCRFLLQSLKDSKLLETFRKIEIRILEINDDAMSSLSIQNWGTNPIQILWMNLPGKVCTNCNSGIGLEGKVNSCFLPASADCYDDPFDVLDIASRWLSTCSESHELCKIDDDGPLPTRLISIADESPRLILTSNLHQRPRYATLSHSWGSQNVIKLTLDDLDSFMRVIPVKELPVTFKDAIKIAKRLGLEYLWIDSLCIIQDSDDDWQKESALMCSVYGGSSITIAASSAKDSTQGCFLKQPYFSGGLRARITDGGRQRVQDFRHPDVYNLSTFETHLGSRAWALQEKMLPPRTIHFSDRGAFWECRTSISSEYLPDGFPKSLVSPLVRRKGKFEWLWPQIVRLYSAADLSFGKDKLPALSGVARLGYNETGDQYLAGLWRGQVEEQLCWHLLGSKATGNRPPWRAPTWSWASIDGKVRWYTPQVKILETKHAHVLDASTTKYGHDPFGQVSSGIIRIACSAIAVAYLAKPKESNELDSEGRTTILLQVGNEEQEFPIQIDCLDEGYQKDNELIHLLPLLSGRTGLATGKTGTEPIEYIQELMVEGIVLRATGATKGEFFRIGSFNFYKNKCIFKTGAGNFEEDTYEPFMQVLKNHGSTTADTACAEVISNPNYPDERYVITLI